MAAKIRLSGVKDAVLVEGDAREVAETIIETPLDVPLVEFEKFSRAAATPGGTVWIAPALVATVDAYEGPVV